MDGSGFAGLGRGGGGGQVLDPDGGIVEEGAQVVGEAVVVAGFLGWEEGCGGGVQGNEDLRNYSQRNGGWRDPGALTHARH